MKDIGTQHSIVEINFSILHLDQNRVTYEKNAMVQKKVIVIFNQKILPKIEFTYVSI